MTDTTHAGPIDPGTNSGANAAHSKGIGESAHIGESLHELADDMLDLMQRLSTTERLLQDASAASDRLASVVESHAARQARAVEQLRDELVGAHRGLIVRGLFNSMATALDSLEILTRASESDGQPVGTQLQATCATIRNLMQAIGFTRFDATVGARFDPERMQCFGYAEGPAGIVVQAIQPGYTAGDVVVRPAGVLIANPTAVPTSVPANERSQAQRGNS